VAAAVVVVGPQSLRARTRAATVVVRRALTVGGTVAVVRVQRPAGTRRVRAATAATTAPRLRVVVAAAAGFGAVSAAPTSAAALSLPVVVVAVQVSSHRPWSPVVSCIPVFRLVAGRSGSPPSTMRLLPRP